MSELSMYERAAAKYKPNKVKLLWIAEAPPLVGAGEAPRYFYFENMTRHDSLFREVMRAMFPGVTVPSGGEQKTGLLEWFRNEGAFLLDVSKDPAESCLYGKWWLNTAEQVRRLDPEHIVVMKVGVCDFVCPKLDAMGFGGRLLTRERVPFPGNGQQTKFHDIVDRLLRKLGIPRYSQRAGHSC